VYVAVKGGERAIANAHALLAKTGRGDSRLPRIEAANNTWTDEAWTVLAAFLESRVAVPQPPIDHTNRAIKHHE